MKRASLATLLLAGTAGGAAFGQSLEGSTLSATISEHIEANSNYGLDDPSPGTSYFADTRLQLGFLNQTQTQTFELGLNTAARALWEAEQPFEVTLASPTGALLNYNNEWSDGTFDAALTYAQRQVDYTTFVDDGTDGGLPSDLSQLQNDTREMRYNANLGVAFGTSTPSSYTLRFIGTRIDYSEDTVSRVPRTTAQGQAGWNLQLNPILASAVTASYVYYDAENESNTQLRRGAVGAGVVYTPGENLTVGAGLNYADRRREDTIDGARETTESNAGPGITGNFTYTTPYLVFTGNGEFTTAAPTDRFFGAISAVYTLPRGRVTGRVFQTYTGTSGGGDEARLTGVSLGVIRDLTDVSNLALNFSYATQVDVDEGPGAVNPDINRANFTATYSHAITDVVDGNIGYSYQSRSEDPQDAQSNAVFVEISRTFETRP